MLITCPALSKLPNVTHGFFTREGGVSEGDYYSLNCGFGSGDNTQHVVQNRFYVARALNVAPSPRWQLMNSLTFKSVSRL